MEANVGRRRGLYGFDFLEPGDQRRVDVEDRKTYDVKQMWQRTHEIVNLAVRGFKQVAIAEILDIHPQTVCNTLNSTLGMEKLSELRESRDEEAKKVGEKIRILTDKALNTYNKLMDDNVISMDPKVAKAAADSVVLELSGLRLPTKVQSHHVSTVLTAEELETFKARGIKAARESGLIVSDEPGGNGDGNITEEPTE